MVQDSNEHKVVDHGEVVVKSQPEERQAAEVRPMRYVLGIAWCSSSSAWPSVT